MDQSLKRSVQGERVLPFPTNKDVEGLLRGFGLHTIYALPDCFLPSQPILQAGTNPRDLVRTDRTLQSIVDKVAFHPPPQARTQPRNHTAT